MNFPRLSHSKENYFLLASLLLIASCGGGGSSSVEDIFLDLSVNQETLDYNEPFTLTWSSNTSQCYASGGWSGEKAPNGSEELALKIGGTFEYSLQCRRLNEYITKSIRVTVNKTTKDHFIFAEEDVLLHEMDISQDSEVKITDYVRGDFNADTFIDIFFAIQTNEAGEQARTNYFQVLGGETPVISELLDTFFIEDMGFACQASNGFVLTVDLDLDTYQDVLIASNSSLGNTNICAFKGSENGLQFDNNIINFEDATLGMGIFNIKYLDLVDKNGNGTEDVLLITETNAYWLLRLLDGISLEIDDYDDNLLADYEISTGTVLNFDNDSTRDLVLAASTGENNSEGAIVLVPFDAATLDWSNLSIVNDMPFTKILTDIDFDGDADTDMLLVGDSSKSSVFEASNSETFKIYERGDNSIIDNVTDLSFEKQALISLNKFPLIADFDLDFDSDFIFSVDPISTNVDNFFVGVKETLESDPIQIEVNFQSDKELGIENFNFENSQVMFNDFDNDYDLDIILGLKSSSNEFFNIYLKINHSN